jgi:hypothetical protein
LHFRPVIRAAAARGLLLALASASAASAYQGTAEQRWGPAQPDVDHFSSGEISKSRAVSTRNRRHHPGMWTGAQQVIAGI